MRGFVSGVIWGGVVAVFGLAVVSQMAPMPDAKATNTNAAIPTSDAPNTAVDATASESPAATPDATDPMTAEPMVPEGEITADTAPADQSPQALATAPAAPALSADGGDNTTLTPPSDPVLSPEAPNAPVIAAADDLPATADLPPVPPLSDEEIALALAEAGLADMPAQPDPAAEAAAEPAPPVQDDVTPEVAATDGLPGNALLPEPSAEPDAQTALLPEADPIPEVPAEPLLDAPALPTPGFGDANGVTTGRLPTITTPAADEAAAMGETAAQGDPNADTPLRKYAAVFTNPSAKPLFSIILIDSGAGNLDRLALAQIPMPVSFAIDPSLPDASKIAAIYRAAGKEVVMLATGLPAGAKASDIEVTFQANAAALPEATAVLDLEEGGFQGDRPLSSLIVPVIKGQGRGLITWDRGLNAATQVAQREDLPRGLVFRRLDAEGESVPTMRRYLDRAAFKAAQDGRVAVVGTTAPDTIAALMEWSVEGRAASVALAPASALLSGGR